MHACMQCLQIPRWGTSDRNLLWVARLFIIPMTAAACIAASLAYDPGYCLVVAFDIVFASVWVPLMAAVYWPGHLGSNAGILSLLTGCIVRVTMQFALPHDQSLIFYGAFAYWYGKAVPGLPSASVMEVIGGTAAEAGLWDPADPNAQCVQGESKMHCTAAPAAWRPLKQRESPSAPFDLTAAAQLCLRPQKASLAAVISINQGVQMDACMRLSLTLGLRRAPPTLPPYCTVPQSPCATGPALTRWCRLRPRCWRWWWCGPLSASSPRWTCCSSCPRSGACRSRCTSCHRCVSMHARMRIPAHTGAPLPPTPMFHPHMHACLRGNARVSMTHVSRLCVECVM